MLPKKRLAKAEQEGDDTIIRGAHASQSFQNVLNMHFESGNAVAGKLEGEEDSEDEESRNQVRIQHQTDN